ncbi:hypothetical protein ACLQ2E_21765 [Streptomyces lavendulocolor]
MTAPSGAYAEPLWTDEPDDEPDDDEYDPADDQPTIPADYARSPARLHIPRWRSVHDLEAL